VYNIIPKSKEWLSVNYEINVARTTLPRFYTFRGKGYVTTTYNFTN
jgi:hypothetical protein